MKLSVQAITEFKELYQNHFGIDISDEEANIKGAELLDLFKLIYRPILKQDNDLFIKLNRE